MHTSSKSLLEFKSDISYGKPATIIRINKLMLQITQAINKQLISLVVLKKERNQKSLT